MKTKTKKKDQPTKSYKKITKKIKYNKKIKAIGNVIPTLDHYPRNRLIGDTDR